MVQVEQVDNATQIVTDPRFGPPSGVSWFESSSRKSDLNTWMLMVGLLVFVLGLILLLSVRRHDAD